MKLKLSDFLTLNLQDFLRGLIMAIGGAIFDVVRTSIEAGDFSMEWASIWKTALAAFVVYLGKQFFTPQPTTVVIDPKKTDVVNSETGKKIA